MGTSPRIDAIRRRAALQNRTELISKKVKGRFVVLDAKDTQSVMVRCVAKNHIVYMTMSQLSSGQSCPTCVKTRVVPASPTNASKRMERLSQRLAGQFTVLDASNHNSVKLRCVEADHIVYLSTDQLAPGHQCPTCKKLAKLRREAGRRKRQFLTHELANEIVEILRPGISFHKWNGPRNLAVLRCTAQPHTHDWMDYPHRVIYRKYVRCPFCNPEHYENKSLKALTFVAREDEAT